MPLPPALAAWLNRQGHDALHAADAGLAQASDEVVFRYAQTHHRVVVTADLDFSRLLALAHTHGPGLILFRGGDYAFHEITGLLQHALHVMSCEKLSRSLTVIERTRLRQRSLPL